MFKNIGQTWSFQYITFDISEQALFVLLNKNLTFADIGYGSCFFWLSFKFTFGYFKLFMHTLESPTQTNALKHMYTAGICFDRLDKFQKLNCLN